MNKNQKRNEKDTKRPSNNIDLSKLRAKTNGEVFTPAKIADEMIDKFAQEDFENKDLNFLDPCFGATAVFPILLMFRLANGLRVSIPNPGQRIRHIVENMLYMAEIDEHACDYGGKLINEYAYLLSVFLTMRDLPDTVELIKNRYVTNYEGIIESFYKSLRKRSA